MGELVKNRPAELAAAIRYEKRTVLRIRWLIEAEEDHIHRSLNPDEGAHPLRKVHGALLAKYEEEGDLELAEGNPQLLGQLWTECVGGGTNSNSNKKDKDKAFF